MTAETIMSSNLHLRLPLEIWRECITRLDFVQVQVLSSTCRYLNDICLPVIFRCIPYKCHITTNKKDFIKSAEKRLQPLRRSMEAFKTLAQSNRHATLVKTCVLSYNLVMEQPVDKEFVEQLGKIVYVPFVRTFIRYLSSFVNLKEVDVQGFVGRNLDKSILCAFANQSSLEILSLRGIEFGQHIIETPIGVRRLSIDNRYSKDRDRNDETTSLELFSPETLEFLSVWSGSYAPKLLRAFTQAGTQLDNLSQLSVCLKSAHFPDLFNFLSLCPNIETVQVSPWREYSDVDLPPLPASTLPRLRSFSGPDFAAKVFVPGRPVTKLDVQPRYFATDTQQLAALSPLLFAFSKSTETLDELFLKPAYPAKDVLDMIKGYFPTLKVFGLSVEQKLGGAFQHGDELLRANGGDYTASYADAYEDPIGGGHGLTRKTHFCYVHYHTDYLDVLQMLASKEIELPPTIKSLHLHHDMFLKFDDHDLPHSDKEEAMYVNAMGRPYSMSRAQDVFQALSKIYPALQSVIVNPDDRGGFRWDLEELLDLDQAMLSSQDGCRSRWSFSTDHDLSKYQSLLLRLEELLSPDSDSAVDSDMEGAFL